MENLWNAGRVSWFDVLDEEQRQKLRAASAVSHFEAGDAVFAPSREPHSVYLLESGLVRIYRLSETGAEASLGYVSPGQVFGELALFGDQPRESFAQATEASTVWRVPRSVFQRTLEAHPRLVLGMTQQISERLKRIENRVENLAFRSVRARVAGMLLELARDFGRPAPGGIGIGVPLTQAELATLVGTTRQSVNACLRELQACGLIGRADRRIIVVNDSGLEQERTANAA